MLQIQQEKASIGMGGSAGKEGDAKKDLALTKELKHDAMIETSVKKLLLLGPGESGKSTLFKQLTITTVTDGFTEQEKKDFSRIIQTNLISYFVDFCAAAEALGFSVPEESKEFLEELKAAEMDNKGCDEIRDFPSKANILWNHANIQKMWEQRSKVQVPECLAYFMSRVDDICKGSYIPSNEDILRVRNRTTGMVEKDFLINGDRFRLIDVGGQRSERRKWMKYFTDIAGVLFTAAISEYDQVLWEDPTMNRVHEALHVFKDAVTNPAFENSAIILFLNKDDLFREKLNRVPLSVCFSEYSGSTYESAAEFIRNRFSAEVPDKITPYIFFTCATDSDKTRHLFNAVRDAVVRKNLAATGLIS